MASDKNSKYLPFLRKPNACEMDRSSFYSVHSKLFHVLHHHLTEKRKPLRYPMSSTCNSSLIMTVTSKASNEFPRPTIWRTKFTFAQSCLGLSSDIPPCVNLNKFVQCSRTAGGPSKTTDPRADIAQHHHRLETHSPFLFRSCSGLGRPMGRQSQSSVKLAENSCDAQHMPCHIQIFKATLKRIHRRVLTEHAS